MTAEMQQHIEALKALAAIASSNFPGATEVTVSVRGGPNSCTVSIPSYEFRKILEAAERSSCDAR